MVLSSFALFGGTLQVPSWNPAIQNNHTYKVSCLLTLALSALVLWNEECLTASAKGFPWKAVATSLALQALFSYKGESSNTSLYPNSHTKTHDAIQVTSLLGAKVPSGRPWTCG